MSDFTTTLEPTTYAEMMRKLSQLSSIEKEAVIQKGISEGLDVIVKEGKRNLQARNNVRTGKLKSSFKKNMKKKDLKGYAGFKRPAGAAAHLVDRGTKERYRRGKVTGSMFWLDAVNNKAVEAQNELIDSVNKSINKIVNR